MTSLLDASSIYGSTAEEQHELRLMFKVENFIKNAQNTQMRAGPSPTAIFRNAVMSMFLG